MRALLILSFTAAALAASPAASQSRPPIPAVVLTRMNTLDQRCTAAGGRPTNARYVHAQDFTGDGRLDYLVSEGDHGCAGRPGLFKTNGEARVDIFVTDARNNARRVFSDSLIAFRLVAGRPVRVQIARKGAACGAQADPTTQCATQLVWNGQAFGEGVSVTREAGGATTTLAPPQAQAARAEPAPTAGAAPPAPAVAGDARAKYLAQCRREHVSRDAGAARWADEACAEGWKAVVAAGPAADALLAVLPTTAAERPTLAAIRQRATGVRWTGAARGQALASGKLGGLDVLVEGPGAPRAVGVNWGATGAMIPYDVVGAMRARGATLAEMSCEKIGTGEGGRSYAGTAPGRAPFTLRIDQRTAPTGNALSYYAASVSLDGRHPPRGSTAGCDF